MGNRLNLSGNTYGRWTVLALSSIRANHSYFLCRCSCGNEKAVASGSLVQGVSTSCGCFRKEVMAKLGASSKTHGATTHGVTTPEWRTWHGLRKRCEDPGVKTYFRY